MKIEVLRGTEKLLFEVLVVEQEHNVDRLLDLADPEKNLVVKLGVLGVDVDSTVKEMISDLRQPSGVIVVARASGSREGGDLTRCRRCHSRSEWNHRHWDGLSPFRIGPS